MAEIGVARRNGEQAVRVALDLTERFLLIIVALPFVLRFTHALDRDPYLLGLILAEMLTVVLLLIRRPGPIAGTPWAFFVALVGTFAPLFVTAPDGPPVIPAGAALMWVGLAISVAAKLSLARSFGMIAANRGVKSRGIYAFIRHPMYLGYAVTHLGFLLVFPNLFNLAVYLTTWTFQLLRIREEERWLCQDEAYREYADRVRYRLIYGVY
ncbi:isoprenylcysteine carboxylmethyltransferase family protein [Sphingomonas sp. BN140010]|uniref:Isoprenylcysteine carboxylmethyltransferase family protein n=1 Tax=Sphingomonas arvum TaxID=2992113 RepID=A0ABT3JD50_9SPHN|nr:isoprenylcysteine carboxylmethyltransferase family protein [Sphingomonas sp. BN140010]MCW3797010.1 isoprenylcysteine carboxylmethyltransferase family protein [Sphingomonas sp. BN140010]